ncbi:unnamed protein product [Amoebophrya sp. A25]|nr:unnamed protein product [Amoebophrya sp. A25]|eukprot:GSA25T00016629001.1
MWPRRAERDLPLLSPGRLWDDDGEGDDDEWNEWWNGIPKKYIRTAAEDYNHEFVLSELGASSGRLRARDANYFANREVSPARTPTDMVQRLPKLKMEDLVDEDDDEACAKEAGDHGDARDEDEEDDDALGLDSLCEEEIEEEEAVQVQDAKISAKAEGAGGGRDKEGPVSCPLGPEFLGLSPLSSSPAASAAVLWDDDQAASKEEDSCSSFDAGGTGRGDGVPTAEVEITNAHAAVGGTSPTFYPELADQDQEDVESLGDLLAQVEDDANRGKQSPEKPQEFPATQEDASQQASVLSNGSTPAATPAPVPATSINNTRLQTNLFSQQDVVHREEVRGTARTTISRPVLAEQKTILGIDDLESDHSDDDTFSEQRATTNPPSIGPAIAQEQLPVPTHASAKIFTTSPDNNNKRKTFGDILVGSPTKAVDTSAKPPARTTPLADMFAQPKNLKAAGEDHDWTSDSDDFDFEGNTNRKTKGRQGPPDSASALTQADGPAGSSSSQPNRSSNPVAGDRVLVGEPSIEQKEESPSASLVLASVVQDQVAGGSSLVVAEIQQVAVPPTASNEDQQVTMTPKLEEQNAESTPVNDPATRPAKPQRQTGTPSDRGSTSVGFANARAGTTASDHITSVTTASSTSALAAASSSHVVAEAAKMKDETVLNKESPLLGAENYNSVTNDLGLKGDIHRGADLASIEQHGKQRLPADRSTGGSYTLAEVKPGARVGSSFPSSSLPSQSAPGISSSSGGTGGGLGLRDFVGGGAAPARGAAKTSLHNPSGEAAFSEDGRGPSSPGSAISLDPEDGTKQRARRSGPTSFSPRPIGRGKPGQVNYRAEGESDSSMRPPSSSARDTSETSASVVSPTGGGIVSLFGAPKMLVDRAQTAFAAIARTASAVSSPHSSAGSGGSPFGSIGRKKSPKRAATSPSLGRLREKPSPISTRDITLKQYAVGLQIHNEKKKAGYPELADNNNITAPSSPGGGPSPSVTAGMRAASSPMESSSPSSPAVSMSPSPFRIRSVKKGGQFLPVQQSPPGIPDKLKSSPASSSSPQSFPQKMKTTKSAAEDDEKIDELSKREKGINDAVFQLFGAGGKDDSSSSPGDGSTRKSSQIDPPRNDVPSGTSSEYAIEVPSDFTLDSKTAPDGADEDDDASLSSRTREAHVDLRFGGGASSDIVPGAKGTEDTPLPSKSSSEYAIELVSDENLFTTSSDTANVFEPEEQGRSEGRIGTLNKEFAADLAAQPKADEEQVAAQDESEAAASKSADAAASEAVDMTPPAVEKSEKEEAADIPVDQDGKAAADAAAEIKEVEEDEEKEDVLINPPTSPDDSTSPQESPVAESKAGEEDEDGGFVFRLRPEDEAVASVEEEAGAVESPDIEAPVSISKEEESPIIPQEEPPTPENEAKVTVSDELAGVEEVDPDEDRPTKSPRLPEFINKGAALVFDEEAVTLQQLDGARSRAASIVSGTVTHGVTVEAAGTVSSGARTPAADVQTQWRSLGLDIFAAGGKTPLGSGAVTPSTPLQKPPTAGPEGEGQPSPSPDRGSAVVSPIRQLVQAGRTSMGLEEQLNEHVLAKERKAQQEAAAKEEGAADELERSRAGGAADQLGRSVSTPVSAVSSRASSRRGSQLVPPARSSKWSSAATPPLPPFRGNVLQVDTAVDETDDTGRKIEAAAPQTIVSSVAFPTPTTVEATLSRREANEGATASAKTSLELAAEHQEQRRQRVLDTPMFGAGGIALSSPIDLASPPPGSARGLRTPGGADGDGGTLGGSIARAKRQCSIARCEATHVEPAKQYLKNDPLDTSSLVDIPPAGGTTPAHAGPAVQPHAPVMHPGDPRANYNYHAPPRGGFWVPPHAYAYPSGPYPAPYGGGPEYAAAMGAPARPSRVPAAGAEATNFSRLTRIDTSSAAYSAGAGDQTSFLSPSTMQQHQFHPQHDGQAALEADHEYLERLRARSIAAAGSAGSPTSHSKLQQQQMMRGSPGPNSTTDGHLGHLGSSSFGPYLHHHRSEKELRYLRSTMPAEPAGSILQATERYEMQTSYTARATLRPSISDLQWRFSSLQQRLQKSSQSRRVMPRNEDASAIFRRRLLLDKTAS